METYDIAMEDKEMYALIGKDNHIWAFMDTFEEVEKIRQKQSDPKWYSIGKVQSKDYFDLETGRIKTNKNKSKLQDKLS